MQTANNTTEFGRMCAKLMGELMSGNITHENYLLTGLEIARHYNKPEMAEGLVEDYNRVYGKEAEPCPY